MILLIFPFSRYLFVVTESVLWRCKLDEMVDALKELGAEPGQWACKLHTVMVACSNNHVGRLER